MSLSIKIVTGTMNKYARQSYLTQAEDRITSLCTDPR